MKSETRSNYLRFRAQGLDAKWAIRNARTLTEWAEAESAGLVRLRADAEQENYFDAFGKPDDERERKAIEDSIERYGNFVAYSEVNHGSEATGDDWRMADSIGMCAGYHDPLDPFENYYVPDLMRAALDQIPQPGNVDELCTSID